MSGHDRLKRAFRLATGVRLSAQDVRDLINGDVAIRDALYEDVEEYFSDARNGESQTHESGESREVGDIQ